MSYSDKIIDHYQNPRNVGSMDPKAKNVGTGIVGAFSGTWTWVHGNAGESDITGGNIPTV